MQDCEEFLMRNFELLRQVKMPSEQEEICKFFCGDPTMQGIATVNTSTMLLASRTVDSETAVSKIPPKKDITRLEVHHLMQWIFYLHNC